MEKPLLGLGRKNDKAIKLHRTLQIDIYKEDCKNIDFLLAGYCLCSITYKVVWYCLNYNKLVFDSGVLAIVETVVIDALGMSVWLFGLFMSVQSLNSYSLMKSKDIRKSAKRLSLYLIIQTFYYMVCTGFIAFYVFNSNKSMNERIMILSLILLMIFSSIFIILYFYSQKYGLSDEIQRFDTTTNKQNAAYRKAYSILDI